MERADHPATAGRVLALGTPFLDPASQAPEAAPPPEPDRAYKALVHVPALLEASPGKGGRVALRTLLGGKPVSLRWTPRAQARARKLLSRASPQQLVLAFWPRTDEAGTLVPKACTVYQVLLPQGGEGSFRVRGRLAAIDLAEGRFSVEIRPNPKGVLRKTFSLVLQASISLLQSLPPAGTGVEVVGEFRPGSRRLVARKAVPAPLWDDPQD